MIICLTVYALHFFQIGKHALIFLANILPHLFSIFNPVKCKEWSLGWWILKRTADLFSSWCRPKKSLFVRMWKIHITSFYSHCSAISLSPTCSEELLSKIDLGAILSKCPFWNRHCWSFSRKGYFSKARSYKDFCTSLQS